MSTEQYVGILISALEDISRRDPAAPVSKGKCKFDCSCMLYAAPPCMGCIAREALKAVPKEEEVKECGNPDCGCHGTLRPARKEAVNA
jgi:hypothetical protein